MLTAKRKYLKHYTKSTVIMPDGSELIIMELPWRNNEIGKSCIPEGIYTVDRDKTGKHRWYRFRDEEVEPRSAIEIHPASRIKHLLGCQAWCYDIKGNDKTSDPIAADSVKACEKLLEWFGDNSFVLRIIEDNGD